MNHPVLQKTYTVIGVVAYYEFFIPSIALCWKNYTQS